MNHISTYDPKTNYIASNIMIFETYEFTRNIPKEIDGTNFFSNYNDINIF